LKKFEPLVVVIVPLLVACTQASSSVKNTESNDAKALVCSEESLSLTANGFLKQLLKEDAESAIKYYAEGYKQQGEGFGLNYTFLPKNDPNALFDIKQKNSESPIFIELMGEYQKGKLVGFFQKSSEGETTNIDYLSDNHWQSFVVCNFECIDGEWRIAGQTCFEDSGSPFE